MTQGHHAHTLGLSNQHAHVYVPRAMYFKQPAGIPGLCRSHHTSPHTCVGMCVYNHTHAPPTLLCTTHTGNIYYQHILAIHTTNTYWQYIRPTHWLCEYQHIGVYVYPCVYDKYCSTLQTLRPGWDIHSSGSTPLLASNSRI